MTGSNITDLRERVERATGGDRELDADLWWAFSRSTAQHCYWTAATGKPYDLGDAPPKDGLGWLAVLGHAPRCTSSIDAALGLVERALPGQTWIILNRAMRSVSAAHHWHVSNIPAQEIVLAVIAALLTALLSSAELSELLASTGMPSK